MPPSVTLLAGKIGSAVGVAITSYVLAAVGFPPKEGGWFQL